MITYNKVIATETEWKEAIDTGLRYLFHLYPNHNYSTEHDITPKS
ncbi:hypothetical protein [Okeania sp. SIO3B5]|nr:hypothetical protein [Okeania sp. SIO3B5]